MTIKAKNHLILFFILFFSLDILVWRTIFLRKSQNETAVYFFDVGQGDSELVNLPGDVQILIDGGKDTRILEELSAALPPFDRYLDILILSNPDADHLGGLIEVLKRYQAGIFISNGQRKETDSFKELEETLKLNQVKTVVLAKGDRIKYQAHSFEVLSPLLESFEASKTNKANKDSLVLELFSRTSKILFTGDIDSSTEKFLIKNSPADELNIDILKVAHHGSKYSTSREFLAATKPKAAVIEVGKNSYGHPTKEVLNRLFAAGSQIFRTDKDGTIKMVIAENLPEIQIFKKMIK